MPEVYDCQDTATLLPGFRAAKAAIGQGELVVFPTDTVYGIAADAFNPAAVNRLIVAKGRTRQSPPPVLIGNTAALMALAAEVSEAVMQLVEAFWPGPLTLVMLAQPSLSWDLGETRGTVALRMPNHQIALELLQDTGPLAVSSANLHGLAAATDVAGAQKMLQDSVQVYLDGGPVSGDGTASTILDVTRLSGPDGIIRVLRAGVISKEQLAAVLPDATIEE